VALEARAERGLEAQQGQEVLSSRERASVFVLVGSKLSSPQRTLISALPAASPDFRAGQEAGQAEAQVAQTLEAVAAAVAA
jgi:hypothetical protein